MSTLTQNEYVSFHMIRPRAPGADHRSRLRRSIEIATRAADHFTRLYYTTYDSATRIDDLPNFYRPNSSLTWNGKPFEGVDGVRELIAGIPATKHDVQSFDCHPIPGSHLAFPQVALSQVH